METICAPQTLDEISIRRSLLEDLALKTISIEGELSLVRLADRMRLNLGIVEALFQRLRREQLCEVKGMISGVHIIAATSQGKQRALELFALNQYAGPVPVSLKEYTQRVQEQSIRKIDVHPADVEGAFQHMVLGKETLTQIGTSVVSGRSIFFYGPSGTGKTAIAETLPRIYHDEVWIPYALEIDGEIISVYDSAAHEMLPESGPNTDRGDRRWVLCRRPRVLVGGELSMLMLDLQFNAVTKFYSAPLQMKANNGVFIIDDFGRQKMPPERLLNRWIVPLDRGIDFLTLTGGKKFEIPFDVLVVFATNLDPSSLADEAFMRRIQTKVKMDYVSREHFREIFRRLCSEFGIAFDSHIVDYVIDLLSEFEQPLRACYPGDIIAQIRWAARYEGKELRLDRTSVAQACRNYFISPSQPAEMARIEEGLRK
jgi:predicted ATPase with chaperone activity